MVKTTTNPALRQGLSLKTNDLTKTFGKFTAVNSLNLTINPGESYGFLGPNGAGKTTTLMMILGVLKPTRGQIFINDQKIAKNAFDIKSRIGVVTEYQAFYEEMSAWEYLMFFANLYDVPSAEARAEALLSVVDLFEWKDVLIGGYSTGMKKKLGFVRALLHSPELLVLDEPVSGLDPFGIIQVRELLKMERAAGCTLLISSHILSEVEKTVDRVGILARGKLLVEDRMENLQSSFGMSRTIHLQLQGASEGFVAAVKNLPFVQKVEQNGIELVVRVNAGEDHRPAIGKCILEHGLVVLEM
jgi:ABC-2 type transport system ATP-binding protein